MFPTGSYFRTSQLEQSIKSKSILYNIDILTGSNQREILENTPELRYFRANVSSAEIVVRIPMTPTIKNIIPELLQSRSGEIYGNPTSKLYAFVLTPQVDWGQANPNPPYGSNGTFTKVVFKYQTEPLCNVQWKQICGTRILFQSDRFENRVVNVAVGTKGATYYKDGCDESSIRDIFDSNNDASVQSNKVLTFSGPTGGENLLEQLESMFSYKDFNMMAPTCNSLDEFNVHDNGLRNIKFNLKGLKYDHQPRFGVVGSNYIDYFGYLNEPDEEELNYWGKQRIQNSRFNIDLGLSKHNPPFRYTNISVDHNYQFSRDENHKILKDLYLEYTPLQMMSFLESITNASFVGSTYNFVYTYERVKKMIDSQTNNFFDHTKDNSDNQGNNAKKDISVILINQFVPNSTFDRVNSTVAHSKPFENVVTYDATKDQNYLNWLSTEFSDINNFDPVKMIHILNLPIFSPFTGKTSILDTKPSEFSLPRISSALGRIVLLSTGGAKQKFIEHRLDPVMLWRLYSYEPFLCQLTHNNVLYGKEIRPDVLMSELMVTLGHEVAHCISDPLIFNLSGKLKTGENDVSDNRKHTYLCSGDGCFNCIFRPHTKYNEKENGETLWPNSESDYTNMWMSDDDFVRSFNQHSFNSGIICENHRNLLFSINHDRN